MKRFLFTIVVIMSLLLCAAFITLWVRSYSGTDYLERTAPAQYDQGSVTHLNSRIAWTHGDIKLSTGRDTVYDLMLTPKPSENEPARPIWRWGRLGRGHIGSEPLPIQSIWNRLGFFQYEYGWEASFAGSEEHGIAVPAWPPVGLCLVLPFFWIKGIMRRRRWRRRGCCRNCGYDLTGNVSGVCPECGTGSLKSLVSRITPENRHGEIDIGKPIGKEIV